MKIHSWLVLLMVLLIILVLAILLPYLHLPVVMICGLLILLLLHFVLKRKFKIPLPFSVGCLLLLAIFADAAGNFFGFYGKKLGPLWYDSWAHLFVSFCISFSLFWVIDFLRLEGRLKLGRALVWIFVFSLAFSITAFYEVTELWDELYFGGKRIWGVHDTSRDLQWDMTGITLGILVYWTTLKINQKLKARKRE